MLGLPDDITALLFDLDGVLTQTAKVHFRAWKQTFDEFLKARDGDSFRAFTQDDYNEHVDGMPRFDGVRSFLRSRDIELPDGSPDDPGDAQTVHGLGNHKNDLVLHLIEHDGVEVYDGSVAYVKAAREAGLKRAVVSASANCKPHPDTYLAGAEAVGVEPPDAAVFEDATAGVQAGHDGHFGYVVGVDRVDHAAALESHGADVVVKDLSELLA